MFKMFTKGAPEKKRRYQNAQRERAREELEQRPRDEIPRDSGSDRGPERIET
jgi:hypothetical protein